jgi:hypothetical protein
MATSGITARPAPLDVSLLFLPIRIRTPTVPNAIGAQELRTSTDG